MQIPFAADFDLPKDFVYLNSGTHSLAPRSVLEAVQRAQRQFESNPTEELNLVWGRLWEVQKRLAEFLGARPQDLFMGQNVTGPMNVGVMGFSLPRGSEILMSDLEYGAVANLCRFRAERDGLTARAFHLPSKRSELKGITPDALARKIVGELGPETKMLVLSHVITGTGLVLPIEQIAHETRKRGILLVVDGAHATGALDFDFTRLGDVDFYAGNLHKWIMGPKGTGFAWVAPHRQAELEPLHAGWTTYEAQPPYNEFGGGHRFAEKFIPSACKDFGPWLAIPEAFAFWRRHGAQAIRARIQELQAVVEREVARELPDWVSASPERGECLGPLLAYEMPAGFQEMGFEFMRRVLREKAVQISAPKAHGRWLVRFSPHVYNTPEDIVRTVKALREFTR